MNLKFEKNKLVRGLKRSGQEYKVLRETKNEFLEPTGEVEEVCSLKAIYHEYHEKSEYIKIQAEEAAVYRSKKRPMLLCLFEDTEPLTIGDYILINGKRHNIIAVSNILEWNIAADISLEVVDNGDKV